MKEHELDEAITFPARLKPQKWLYLANTFLAPPPRGVVAAVSLFVSSTNSIQIVRRQCCLIHRPVSYIFLTSCSMRQWTLEESESHPGPCLLPVKVDESIISPIWMRINALNLNGHQVSRQIPVWKWIDRFVFSTKTEQSNMIFEQLPWKRHKLFDGFPQ